MLKSVTGCSGSRCRKGYEWRRRGRVAASGLGIVPRGNARCSARHASGSCDELPGVKTGVEAEMSRPSDLSDYRVVIDLPVQWGDQDPFGHVNNVTHIRWFESGRVAYLERLGMRYMVSPEGKGLILAAVTCNYLRQINFPDTVQIGSRVTRIGNSSLIMAHAVYSDQQQTLVADGESVVVFFDYATSRPRRVPDDFRDAIKQLDGDMVE